MNRSEYQHQCHGMKAPTPKPARVRMAETRARRRAAGLCESCGRPAVVRVIQTADGREIERRTLTRCEMCREPAK